MTGAVADHVAARSAWLKSFPLNEVQRASEFIRTTWNEIASTKPDSFAPTLRENTITETLASYIQKTALAKGRLTGFWGYEEQSSDLAEITKKRLGAVNRIRKDLVYKSNAKKIRLQLTYEFKKIKATNGSCKTYRGKDGMRRFVDGHYAQKMSMAAMVGMVIGGRQEVVDMLRRSLLSPAGLSDLKMVVNSSQRFLDEPSALLPGVAEFDTEHVRSPEKAPEHGTIRLAHMFLQMPEAVEHSKD